MMFDPHGPQSDVERPEYGTSPLLPADDPGAWPLLQCRQATLEVVEALRVKLNALERAAELFRQSLLAAEDEDIDLIVATEDDPLYFTRLLLPAALPEQLELALTNAGQFLREGEHAAAVAHLRLAEVLLRLGNGWGHANVQAQADGFMGLKKGQRAGALILTTGVSRSEEYGDMAERSVTVMGE